MNTDDLLNDVLTDEQRKKFNPDPKDFERKNEIQLKESLKSFGSLIKTLKDKTKAGMKERYYKSKLSELIEKVNPKTLTKKLKKGESSKGWGDLKSAKDKLKEQIEEVRNQKSNQSTGNSKTNEQVIELPPVKDEQTNKQVIEMPPVKDEQANKQAIEMPPVKDEAKGKTNDTRTSGSKDNIIIANSIKGKKFNRNTTFDKYNNKKLEKDTNDYLNQKERVDNLQARLDKARAEKEKLENSQKDNSKLKTQYEIVNERLQKENNNNSLEKYENSIAYLEEQLEEEKAKLDPKEQLEKEKEDLKNQIEKLEKEAFNNGGRETFDPNGRGSQLDKLKERYAEVENKLTDKLSWREEISNKLENEINTLETKKDELNDLVKRFGTNVYGNDLRECVNQIKQLKEKLERVNN